MMGWSVESVPSAPGALLVQSGMAGCTRATSGRADVAVVGFVADVTAGAGLAGTLAQPIAPTARSTNDEASEYGWRYRRIMRPGDMVFTKLGPAPAQPR